MEKTIPGTALLRKLFVVLDIVGQSPGDVTVAGLSSQTGWPRATLYRILSAATAHGFLRLDPRSNTYTLGFRFIELAQNVWSSGDLVTTASLELRRLRDITGETTHLGVLQGDQMLALGKFEGPHPHKDAARLGIRKPLHSTSQGKAVLAFLPEHDVEALIARMNFRSSTKHSITDPDLLRSQLRIIRQRGYAIDDEEAAIGTRCVGAPILDSTGRPVAAISLAGPTYRVTNERVERLGPEVAQVAHDIAQLLRNPVPAPAHPADWPAAHPGHRDPALHGVSPSWDAGRQCLHWADRFAPRLHSSEATTRAHGFTSEVAIDAVGHTSRHAVAFAKGALLLVDGDGLAHERRFEPLKNLTCLAVRADGTPFGAIYCEYEARTKIGTIAPSGEIVESWSLAAHVEHMVWSPDGGALYASVPQRGLIYSLTQASPNPRILARISKASGEPHGLAVDADGRLWVALYDGWSIARLTHVGEIDHVIALPVPRPTGLAFSDGSDGTLHVTTARMDLAREVLENAPLSGRLLTVKAPVRGTAPPPMNYAPGDG
ncbi:hypothetical protein K32_09830 [Kaistia sp. 32K]|uniref:IclR family transcriptional regulator domain-containing protein n=1 Tax=Kaistia sp. 32K TaxID=2795690 RepID=UPI0019160AF3|nr:IclR family transcriptional regulator C-terminal domain-containing protein [Kaistia sp. 32K]BCP52366.1 hypothetical protein K32_09830 [Kaistia sp. 32K]